MMPVTKLLTVKSQFLKIVKKGLEWFGTLNCGKVNVSENGRFIMKTKKTKAGFTLVEILIVVVILGILAAIVIPQFTQASTEARENSLRANLQTIRSQIELYKIQHNDNEPTLAAFTAQMTAQTDITGAAGTDFGPYLQQIPVNPFTNDNTVDHDGTAGNGSWDYDEADGSFLADNAGADASGQNYVDY